MTDAHNPKLLSDADAAADFAGLPRPSAQIAHIMALVGEYARQWEISVDDSAEKIHAQIEAALLAPQQAEGWVMVPDGAAPMNAARASFFMDRFLKEEKLLGPNEQAALHFVIAMLAATPNAPTAEHKPLFGEMIAQHPGLREEIAEESERADFEAWWEQFAAEHEEWRFADSHALRWQAWRARASKGTK